VRELGLELDSATDGYGFKYVITGDPMLVELSGNFLGDASQKRKCFESAGEAVTELEQVAMIGGTSWKSTDDADL